MLQKACKKMQMSCAEMRSYLIEIGGVSDTTRDRWLANTAAKIGISFRTARSIFYGTRVDPKYALVLQAAKQKHLEQQAALAALEKKDSDGQHHQIIAEIRAAHEAIGALLLRLDSQQAERAGNAQRAHLAERGGAGDPRHGAGHQGRSTLESHGR